MVREKEKEKGFWRFIAFLAVPYLTPPAWLWAAPHIPSPFLAAEPSLFHVKHGLQPCCMRPLAAAGKETFGSALVNHYSACAWGGRCWHFPCGTQAQLPGLWLGSGGIPQPSCSVQ